MSAVCDPVSAGPHHLSDEEVAAFLARAGRLGHDPARLLAGEVTETLTSIPSLEQLRQLSNASPAERRARQAVFFHPAIAIRSRLGQGVHDRCEAYVFADGIADDADRARLARHLPFPARLLSVLCRTVAAGEVWDLTVAPRLLGMDERDDLLNVVNVGELAIEPGGRVIVQGNLLVLGCQHLRHPAPGQDSGDYQLGVLPTPYPVDPRTGPMSGMAGAPGRGGAPGRAGTRPAGVPTMIGFALGEPPEMRMNGTGGADGARGGDGDRRAHRRRREDRRDHHRPPDRHAHPRRGRRARRRRRRRRGRRRGRGRRRRGAGPPGGDGPDPGRPARPGRARR